MNDPDPLDNLLQEWHPQPSAQPEFSSKVHGRLANDEASKGATILRFPAALPLAASLAIVAGTVAGISVNDNRNEQRMADAYARSIDPVQMVNHSHR